MKGIDISEFQENINYSKLKEQGIEFAIIRLGYGKNISQKDEMFEKHFEGLKNVGIKVGAYLYSYAYVKEGAKLEAENTLEIIKGKQFDLPIFYDMEESKQANLGKKVLTDMANEWCKIIKNAGYKAGVYANLNWFKNYLNPYEIKAEENYIWLALWNNDENPNVSFPVDFWQYTSEGKVEGINGNVDLDKSFTQDFSQTVGNLPKYEIGKNYTIQVDLNVRTGPTTNYRIKNYKELTLDGKRHAYKQTSAVLKPKTKVTCLDVFINNDEIWLRIPSGYVCGYYQGKTYIK